jgi:hypothetical protein
VLPFATLEDKLRVVHAIAGDELEFLFYDGNHYWPATRNRQTGELIMWNVHGGRRFTDAPTSVYSVPRPLAEWAQHVPTFFVRSDGSPILFPPARHAA